MKKVYRARIHCLSCEGKYWTNLLRKPMPRKCKLCGSIKLELLDRLEV